MRYREDRTTQAAARLLRQHDNQMPYLKLLKLLYLADRKALAELGRPISFDYFVSMPQGPVLSRTYDLMVGEQPDASRPSYWRQYISEPEGYNVGLIRETPNDQLSPAEESILDQVFAEYGRWDRWRLVAYTHTLPEYQDSKGSSLPIELRDILMAQNVTEEDAEAVEAALAAESAADLLTE